MKNNIYSLIVLISLFSNNLFSQVVINEFSAANFDSYTDSNGDYEDWIELYNPMGNAVDISGWYISDKISNPTKFEFPAGTVVNANGYLVIWASGNDEVANGEVHTNFKITQTKNGEAVILTDSTGSLVDDFPMIDPIQKGHSVARLTDGDLDWGIAEMPSFNGSNNNVSIGYTAKPGFDIEGGIYNNSVTISVANLDPDFEYRYTTDGSTPTLASALLSAPLTIANTIVIRCRAFDNVDGRLPGFIGTHTYWINENHSLPLVSIAGDEIESLLDGNGGMRPEVNIELFGADGVRWSKAYGTSNKHGNDSWAYAQRGLDYITEDEMGYDNELHHKIFPTKDREDFQRIMLKPAANDNYPFANGAHIRDAYVQHLSQLGDMHLDERSNQSCVLYVNGQYWGLYEIREKVDDHDFTKYYYDQGRSDLQYLKTWGGTWAEYGGNQAIDDWNVLHDFIVTNDMSDFANYSYVQSQLNVLSLIDYILLNTHVVCMDWLNYNTAWWRGTDTNGGATTWRYTLWDMDATFGHYVNYTNIPDTSADADPCNTEELYEGADFEGHTEMITSLQANQDFYDLYINRYADLNNTVFSCSNMIGILESMIAEIEPEMPRQISRWGGDITAWEGEVQELKDFINARCTVISTELVDCYEIEGPYLLTVDVNPANSGILSVNTYTPDLFPWSGEYFEGTNNILIATPENGFEFSHWEIQNTTSTYEWDNSDTLLLNIDSETTVIAFFDPITHQIVLEVDPTFSGFIMLNTSIISTFPHNYEATDGEILDLSIIENIGFQFTNWSTDYHTPTPDFVSTPIQIIAEEDDTIVAHFIDLPQITFDVNPTNGGTLDINGTEYSVFPVIELISNPTQYDVKALSNSGFYFDNWTVQNHVLDPDNSASDISFLGETNDNIVANFLPFLNLEINIDLPSYGTVNLDGVEVNPVPSNFQYEQQIQIELESIEEYGYVFDHWESLHHIGDYNATDQIIQFILEESDSFTAVFVPDTFQIVIYGNENGTTFVNGVQMTEDSLVLDIAFNENIDIEFVPNDGFIFENWSENGEIINTGTGIIDFIVSENTSISPSVSPIQTDCVIVFPTAFSPNGDNHNNDFKPVIIGCNIEDYSLKIYERWGRKVFETNDVLEAWNGVYLNGELPIAAYAYQAEMTVVNNGLEKETILKTGYVQLLR